MEIFTYLSITAKADGKFFWVITTPTGSFQHGTSNTLQTAWKEVNDVIAKLSEATQCSKTFVNKAGTKLAQFGNKWKMLGASNPTWFECGWNTGYVEQEIASGRWKELE